MDRAGVAACIIFHGGLNGQSIPFSTTGLISWGHSRYNELEPVGVRIYNRWLADFVAEAPERHFGIAHIPISDPEACVREVEWAAEHGLSGINLPAPRGDFPMLNDPVWEPLWAACQATGLSLNTHGGGGEHYPYEGPGAQAMYMMETAWRTRRGVWVMILGGTFARHPGLKLVLTEQWIDWSTQVMSDMDGLFHGPNGISLRASLREAAVGVLPRALLLRGELPLELGGEVRHRARPGRQHDVGRRLPAPRGHVAAHAGGHGAHLLRHRPEVRGADPRRGRHRRVRPRPSRSSSRWPTASARRSPSSRCACTPPEGETAGLYAFRTDGELRLSERRNGAPVAAVPHR